jgi:FAD/FMN-containing dehydrogenase
MTDLIGRTLHRLTLQLPGRVSMPGNDRYAAATAIWAKSDRTPRAVVHCQTAEDVQATIRASRTCDLPLSVRGGGHDWAGRALCDGLVIDLSGMNRADLYLEISTVKVGGGTRASGLLEAIEPFGMAAVTGSCGPVGMAGLALGGGYGPLIGRFGLALDNLLAVEVVLSDGRIVTAHNGDEQELFWALRGGGGNFGVVTNMHFRLHYLSSVRSGMLVYPFAEARTVLQGCAEIAASAPDDLTVQLGFVKGADGEPVVLVVPTWCGPAKEGEGRVGPFLRLGTLLAGAADTMSYKASLTAFDPYIVNGQSIHMETCWIPAIDGSSITPFIEVIERADSPGCALFTHDFKGAASRVPADATAFGLRRDHLLVEIMATTDERADEKERQRHREWATDALRAFDAVALPGGYPNLLGRSEVDRAAHSFGANAYRLIRAKRHYDPDNVFRSTIPLPSTKRSDDGGSRALTSRHTMRLA